MTNFESYRNTIIYQDLDQYGYLDNSKIENIFEISEDFFFSLTNFKKKTLIKDTIKTKKINLLKFNFLTVNSSYNKSDNEIKLTHKLLAHKAKSTKQNIISLRENIYEINNTSDTGLDKIIVEGKLDFYSAYKGIVCKNECDQMAHMNVQFYFEKHSKALVLFMDEVFVNNSLTKVQSERCIFHKEVHEKDSLEILFSIKSINKNTITIISNLYCVSGNYSSAFFETIIKFVDEQRLIKEKIDNLLNKPQLSLFNQNIFHKLRKFLPTKKYKKPAKNSFLTCRKAVNSWDLDRNGFATTKFKISCVSDAATQFFTRCGADYNWRKNFKIGSAALDYFVRYYNQPTLGMALSLQSNFLEIGNKTFKFCHHLIDDSNNKVLMDIYIVAVLFDIEKRKAIEIPKSFKKLASNLIAIR